VKYYFSKRITQLHSNSIDSPYRKIFGMINCIHPGVHVALYVRKKQRRWRKTPFLTRTTFSQSVADGDSRVVSKLICTRFDIHRSPSQGHWSIVSCFCSCLRYVKSGEFIFQQDSRLLQYIGHAGFLILVFHKIVSECSDAFKM